MAVLSAIRQNRATWTHHLCARPISSNSSLLRNRSGSLSGYESQCGTYGRRTSLLARSRLLAREIPGSLVAQSRSASRLSHRVQSNQTTVRPPPPPPPPPSAWAAHAHPGAGRYGTLDQSIGSGGRSLGTQPEWTRCVARTPSTLAPTTTGSTQSLPFPHARWSSTRATAAAGGADGATAPASAHRAPA